MNSREDVTRASLRPVGETVPQPWERLGDWLSGRGIRLDSDVVPRQFAGGLANLNYLVSVDGAPAVVRRPPAGQIAEGANDMRRESRVLSRLAEHYPLAPRSLEFCDDVSVLGAPFQLLEFRRGVAVGAQLPPELAARQDSPKRLTDNLVRAMTGLHALDPAAVGLGDLGRPDGFLLRQVEGWSRRCDAAYDGLPPAAATALVDRLRRTVPHESGTSLLHCDFKFDNMLIDLERIEAVAVVDWDMATRGDPLFDLAIILSYWIEPSDPQELHALQQVPSLLPGFVSRRELAQQYFSAAGRDPVDLRFYMGLARLRLAVAWQQLYARYLQGVFTDQRYAGFGQIADALLIWTTDIKDEET